MTKLFSGRAYYLIAFGIPLLMIAALASLATSSMFSQSPDVMSTAIVIDLIIVVPLVYLALIRRRPIPNTTAMPMLILGLLVASFVIPKEHQSLLEIVKFWVVPIIELAILAFIATKVWKMIKAYKAVNDPSADFHVAVRTAATELMGKRIGGLLASEIGMIYYGIWGGKKATPGEGVFFYHQKTTSIMILWALFVLLIIETALIHLFLMQWNEVVAWIIFVISVYSGIQLLAILRATTRRPIFVANNKLFLRFSVMQEAVVDFDNIEQVQLSNEQLDKKEALSLNPFNLVNEHNVILRLKEPTVAHGMLGFEKQFETLMFYVDEPEKLKKSLELNTDQP